MKITRDSISFDVEVFEHLPFWNSIARNQWEADTYTILNAFTKEGSTMIDVGSWAGPISLYAAAKKRVVYALEPDPSIFTQLVHNVELNPQLKDRIHCFPLALSATTGKQTLYARNEYGQSSSSILHRSRDLRSDQSCQTIRLEDFIANQSIKKIDFIKLDIEGGEFVLLPEIGQALKELNFPILYVSFHFHHLLESLLKERFSSNFWSKVYLKLDQMEVYTPFKQAMKQAILNCFSPLQAYRYIYTSRGKLITLDQLMRRPFLIKKENLVFSNKKWEADV